MPDLSADEAAILALIHANRITVWTHDFEGYAQCFVHDQARILSSQAILF